ncbi:MAG: sugar phosphate nucleotidyltransferase [Candidatus Cloacimonetes bacterium]|nr:sugar phosphate nucleotidyltransferase [Candidatus Cloacimonadota bacterium]
MKGVILAGGMGSRLFPLTKVTNKHLLPVGDKPMIFHPIQKLLVAGIDEIMIITGIEHMGAVVNLLGSGKEFGCQFTYRVQDEPGGIAQALGLAESFVGNNMCTVILGDNIFEDEIGEYISNFKKQKIGSKILLKEVTDPQRYGVAELSNSKIISIEEKPQKPKSNMCVTGIYMYDYKVFEYIKTLKPSGRGELEITDVNNKYVQTGEMTFDVLKGWWTDAGTFPSYYLANDLAFKNSDKLQSE